MLLTATLGLLALGRVVEQEKPFTNEEYWTLWQHFRSIEGNGVYATAAEHNAKFDVFKANMDFAREFNNNGTHSFKMGITRFADMTRQEFMDWLKKTSGTKPANNPKIKRSLYVPPLGSTPNSKDWTDSPSAVTPIKNQGQCGSCWAFSTTGGIEGANFLKTGTLSSFSEQELVDCSQAEGNQGCDGGLMDDGFEYVESHGLCFESAYPYEGSDGTCRASSCTSRVSVASYTDIPQGSTSALLSASATVGPISIAVDANFWWQMYSDGIFNHACDASKLDHGVLLVGYNTSGGYWKVKNSWGETWGESGFIRLAGTDANTCGLANSASYPVL